MGGGWQAVRYRRGQACAIAALAALVTAAAVTTPLYDRSMQQSAARVFVDAAPVADTAVRVTSLTRADPGSLNQAFRPTPSAELLEAVPASLRPAFLTPIASTSVFVVEEQRSGTSPQGTLLWRQDACRHLTLVSGRCPAAAGEVVVSEADAISFGLGAGSTVRVLEVPPVSSPARHRPVALTVVGAYRQVEAAYWGGAVLTGLSGVRGADPPNAPYHDTWLTDESTFGVAGRPVKGWTDETNQVELLLDRSRVDVDDVLRLGPAVAAVERRSAEATFPRTSAVPATVTSALPELSRQVREARDQARITVPLLVLQLALLATVVLWLVLGAAVAQRRQEVAQARLRGQGARGARRLLTRELVPIVVVGWLVGVGAGFAVAWYGRVRVQGDRAGFEAGWLVAVVAAATLLLMVAMTWLAARRTARAPVLDLLRQVPPRSAGWALGSLEAMLVAAAATAAVGFLTRTVSGLAALVAPALLALVAGLLLGRAAGPVAASSGRRLLRAGRYAGGTAVLATARRPATRSVVTILTVSSALLVFATVAVTVGARNRASAAEQQAGAPAVAAVETTDVEAVRAVVEALGSREATTVTRVDALGLTTLAVVPDEFERIALLPGIPLGELGLERLTPEPATPMTVTGTFLSFVATTEGLSRDGSTRSRPRLEVGMLTGEGTVRLVALGDLPLSGDKVLQAAVPCAEGCVVNRLSVYSVEGVRGRVTLSEATVPDGQTTLPGAGADWAGTGEPGADNSAQASGPGAGSLDLDFDNRGNGRIEVSSVHLPAVLPAVLTRAAAGDDDAAIGSTLAGRPLDLSAVRVVPRAPGALRDVAIVDLGVVERYGGRLGERGSVEVWLGDDDPELLEQVQAALADADLPVGSVTTLTGLRQQYDDSVPAWSLQLGLLVAAVGLLIGAGMLVVVALTSWRQRARDLAALRMAGAPRTALGVVAAAEQLPAVVLATAAGAACGLVGAHFALPVVPLLSTPPEVSTLDLSLPWSVALAAAAAQALVLVAVATLTGRRTVARGELGRLREAAL